MSTEKRQTGWWNPEPFRSTSKFHYVTEDGRTLCRKWGYMGRGLVEEGQDDHVDNCAACKKAKPAYDKKEDQAMTNDPKPVRLPVTPGEATIAAPDRPWVNNDAGFCIADFGWDEDMGEAINAEAIANATLYADAHNSYNRVSMLPSELEKERADLTRKLGEAVKIITDNRNRVWQAYQETYRSIGLNYERACKRADEDTLPIDTFLSTLQHPSE